MKDETFNETHSPSLRGLRSEKCQSRNKTASGFTTQLTICEPTEQLQQRSYSRATVTSSEFILIINEHQNNPVLITFPGSSLPGISNRTSLAGLLVHRVLHNFTLKSSVANFNYFLPARSACVRILRRKRSGSHLNTEWLLKDTVDDAAALDVALLAEMQLDELPEAAGVVVVDRLGVSKGLHDGTVAWRRSRIIN